METSLQDKQLCLKILLHRAWLNFQDSCLWKATKAGPGTESRRAHWSPATPVLTNTTWHDRVDHRLTLVRFQITQRELLRL